MSITACSSQFIRSIALVFVSFYLIMVSHAGYAANWLEIDGNVIYQSWTQSDLPKVDGIANPIKHEYEIDNSLAWQIDLYSGAFENLFATYGFLVPLNLSFTNQPEASGSNDTLASSTALTLLTGLILPNKVGLTYEFQKTETKGSSFAFISNTNQSATVNFTTEIGDNIIRLKSFHDSWAKGFNVGYRTSRKTIPQSLYLMSDKNNLSTLVNAMLIDPQVQWDAKYGFLGYQNTVFKGRVYVNVEYGIGNASVTSDTLASAGVTEFAKGGYASYRNIKIELRHHFNKLNGTVAIGYFNTLETIELDQKNDVHIFARSKTELSGPYLSLGAGF